MFKENVASIEIGPPSDAEDNPLNKEIKGQKIRKELAKKPVSPQPLKKLPSQKSNMVESE